MKTKKMKSDSDTKCTKKIKINKKRKVRKVEEFLNSFCQMRKNEQRKFLNDCHPNLISCLSEACYNLLKNIHLKNNKKVVRNRSVLEKLLCGTCDRRREILTSTNGDRILALIKVVLLPFLTNLLKLK